MHERPGMGSAGVGQIGPSSTDVRVFLLGRVAIETGATLSVAVPGILGALVARIATLGAPGTRISRDAVAFQLWPDRPENDARKALTDALYRLRRLVGSSDDWLTADRHSLVLAGVWVDADAFVALADSSDPVARRAALDLYAGDLAPSVDDEWAELPRAALRDRHVALLADVAAEREAAGDLAVAVTVARRWAASDPFDETAHRAVIRLYGRLDRHAAAVDHYEALAARLRSDLGVMPDVATQELAQRIRTELDLSRRMLGPRTTSALVGRDDERNRLLGSLDRASSGHGGLILVLGEAGIGKTRILEEIEASATWRGWQVSWGKGEQFGLPAPYAPLADAMRAAASPPRTEQLRQVVEPGWLAGASALIPTLRTSDGPRTREPDRDRLTIAAEHVIRGLGRLGPQLFLLDDMQWADEGAWALLDRLHRRLQGMPVLIVASGRTEELQARPDAWDRIRDWDRAGVQMLRLPGLDVGSLASLAIDLDGRRRSRVELGSLLVASGGNPLLALALLRSGDQVAATEREGDGERRSLDRLFLHRLDALTAAAKGALQAAAVVGPRIPYDVWQEVAAEFDLSAVVSEIEQSALMRIEGSEYVFAHDTLRSLVVWGLSDDLRRSLNAAAYEARERRAPDDVLVLLFHAEQMGALDRVASLALRAGEEALRGASFEAALRHFDRVLELAPPTDLPVRYRAVLGRARALGVLAQRDRQRIDLNELQDLADTLGDASKGTETAIVAAEFHWAVGEYAAASAIARRAFALADAHGDVADQAALLAILGRILREQGQLAEASSLLTRARDTYGRLGDDHGTATVLELLGGIAWRLGDHRTAAMQHREAARLFERTGDARRAAISLNGLGSALWGLGEYDEARTTHERSLTTCRAIGDRRGESDNLDNLGGVAWVLGDFEQAIALYQQALAIRRTSSDPRGVAISLINLGDTHGLVGRCDIALGCYDEALAVDPGVQRNRATAYQGKGQALLLANRPGEAQACLMEATTLHLQLGDRHNLLETRAALARSWLELGDLQRAHDAATAAAEALDPLDRPTLRQHVHLACWKVLAAKGDVMGAETHLAHAAAAMDAFVDALPVDARQQVLDRVPVHRETMAARLAARRTVTAVLARSDAPLGRTIGHGETVRVTWTVGDPADAATIDPSRRRRRVLRRLLDEASAQGASPTDDDLAQVLGVSRRTIIRDARDLAVSGERFETRRRTHRSRAAAPNRGSTRST